MSLPKIEVNIWSDVACPWCWVGMQRYKRAKAILSGKAVIVTRYHAYMIDPATKKEGEEYLAYNIRRWGSDSWTGSLKRSGRPDGAEFANWKWWPNTLQAHQLITIAEEEEGKGFEAKEALLKATYEEGRNISSLQSILEIAEQLDLKGTREKLEDSSYRSKVIEADKQAKQELGIHGVPHFVFGTGSRALSLHGAQSNESLQQAILSQLQ